jgi:hypothetical protein
MSPQIGGRAAAAPRDTRTGYWRIGHEAPLRELVISRCRCGRAAVRLGIGRQNGPVACRGRRFVNRASPMTLNRDLLPVLPVVLPVTKTTIRGITANRRFARISGAARGRCIRRNYVDRTVACPGAR